MTPRTARLIGLHAAGTLFLSAAIAKAKVADIQSRAVALIGVASYVNDHCSAFWSKPSALLARLASIGVQDPWHLPIQVWIDGETKAIETDRDVGAATIAHCQALFESFGGDAGGSIPYVFGKGQRAPANPFDGE